MAVCQKVLCLPQLKQSSAPFGLIQTEIQTRSFMLWRNWDCTSVLALSVCKIAENYTVLGTCAKNLINPGNNKIKDLVWRISRQVFKVFPVFMTSSCPLTIGSAPRPYLNAQLEQAIRRWHVTTSLENLSHTKKPLYAPKRTNSLRSQHSLCTCPHHKRWRAWNVQM